MKIAIVSASLNPDSRSRRLAKLVWERYSATDDVKADLIDLQEMPPLPLCDGASSYGDPSVEALTQRLSDADAFVLASSIYNYDVNAAMKNVIEHAGRCMEGKLVGFLCAAGGPMSYMAPMAAANSLMLDFRVIVLPRFVYTTGADWEEDRLRPKLQERLRQFEDDFLALARRLQ